MNELELLEISYSAPSYASNIRIRVENGIVKNLSSSQLKIILDQSHAEYKIFFNANKGPVEDGAEF